MALSVLLWAVLLWIGLETATGQRRDCNDPSRYRTLTSVEDHPKLGIEYTQVARFKLASRKTEYRVGEIISVDVAMLNASKTPNCFLKPAPWTLTFTAHKEDQVSVQVFPFRVHQLGYNSHQYSFLSPN